MENDAGARRGSLTFAALGAFDAAVISALAWAVATVLTKYQIGYMAIGVGALVGISVRYFGQGCGASYRVLSVAFSLLGCLSGNYLSQVGFYLAESGAGLMDVALSLRLSRVPAVLAESFSPIDLLFYGLAAFQAWKLAVAPGTADPAGGAGESTGVNGGPEAGSGSFLFSYPPKKALAAGLPLLAILALPVYVAAHSDGTARDVYDSGAVRYEGRLSWNEPNGAWKYWYENGSLMAEVEFRRGLLEGVSVHYAEDGSVSERKQWKAGFLHGTNEQYYPDGKIRAKGRYEYDRKIGVWEEYRADGSMSAKGPMLLDRQHGSWEYRSETGALRERGDYEMGENVGIWETFSDKGELVLRREFADGETRILYQRDGDRETVVDGEGRYVERYGGGTVAAEGTVVGGRKTGVWREWYENGKPKRVYEFENGRLVLRDYYGENGERPVRDGNGSLTDGGNAAALIQATYLQGLLVGEFRLLYPDGKPMSLSMYSAGRLEGAHKTYGPGGNLLTQGEFRNDRQSGVWTWYAEDGSISSTVEYVDGKKTGIQSFYEDGVLVKEEVYRDGAYVETRPRR